MSDRRVVVTGMAGISPLGNSWAGVHRRLLECRNAVRRVGEWAQYDGLHSHLGAPAAPFELPAHYNRKTTRSMGRVALMATLATEWALADAGLLGDPVLRNGRTGIAYGSASGSPDALEDFTRMVWNKSRDGVSATTYLKMMSHTAAVNIGVFFGITGRIVPTSSACTSGSQGIGYAYESIKAGKQIVMVAGGAEELDVRQVAIFDTLYAASVKNESPASTPRAFDRDRDGLVLGEGAGTLILEDRDHALARGAGIHAEVVGFGTNSDGSHVTFPKAEMMRASMELALSDAQLAPGAIGYVNAHGTATDQGDAAESRATAAVIGAHTPVSTLKNYMGHTLGACGALEAWMTIEMMRNGWVAPNINLDNVASDCAGLDYVVGAGRRVECEYVMTNNFAFGGINTSLILRRT
ncbi:MAG: beta-ketoacyl-ACP synthase [Gemmatimonadaceae bacterium]